MAEKKLADLVKPEDFKQVRHIVFMKNETSQTSFTQADQIVIRELGENFLVLEGPAKCCQSGHQVTISLIPFRRKTEPQKLSANIHAHKDLLNLVAKVEEHSTTDMEEGRASWRVVLIQFNKEDWQYIQYVYEQHQKTINHLVSEKDS